MHKNCCHQSCSFWLRYASNRLSAGALPQPYWGSLPDPLAGLGVGPPGKGKDGGEVERKDGWESGREREGRGKGGRGGSERRGGSPGMPKSRVGKATQWRRLSYHDSFCLWQFICDRIQCNETVSDQQQQLLVWWGNLCRWVQLILNNTTLLLLVCCETADAPMYRLLWCYPWRRDYTTTYKN